MADPLQDMFLAILSRHRGLAQAISVPDMAELLGFGRDKLAQRKAQHIKAAVVAAGTCVGSSCGKSHGWFLPVTPDEVQSTVAQYTARIRGLAALIRQTQGAAGVREFLGQLQMEFGGDA